MNVLGISAFYHDSAAALVRDGKIIAAAQEERFSRRKHDPRFPDAAIRFCLEEGQVELSEIDQVVFYDKPFLTFERLLETYLTFVPRGFTSFKLALPIWIREKLFQKHFISKELRRYDPSFDSKARLLFSEHHFSHAASAFYPSPFNKAVVLTMDGVGEWATTSLATGDEAGLRINREIHFPHSLGLLYSAMTYYCGFKVNSGEYKLMGLAPYGEPKYRNILLDNVINVKEDGSFRLDQSYFEYCYGLRMTGRRWDELLGGPPRKSEEMLTQKDMDLAASVQAVTETVILRLARAAARDTGIPNLCLAGGVALNCVANGKIQRDGSFDKVWVQPASGDAGGALGAALAGYHHYANAAHLEKNDAADGMGGAYLGPAFKQDEIEKRLSDAGAFFERVSEENLISRTADALAAGQAVGWFQGRMEFGPRALGARSILADPRSPLMQKTLNLKVKYRESFRPFAPAILQEEASEWFQLNGDSPYMAIVAQVAKNRQRSMTKEEKSLFGLERLNVSRSDIPAVTHVDYSARIQTIHRETNPLFYSLVSAFRDRTGCPVVVNTSFNIRGEPIVCSPEDAFHCMMGSEIDLLAIGNCLLQKEAQNPKLRLDYRHTVEAD